MFMSRVHITFRWPIAWEVLKSTLVVDNDRQCTMYIHTQSLSAPQSWSSVVSVFVIRHWRAIRERLKKTIHGIWHSHIVYCFIKKNQSKSLKRMEGENRWVYQFTPMSRIGSNRLGADGVRVDNFPMVHFIADSRRDPENDDWNSVWTWAIPRTDSLHVNVQWHWMERKKATKHCVLRIPKPWQVMQEDSRTDIGCFSGLDQKKNWCGTHTYKPSRKWDDVAEHMMLNFSESGHPVFRGSSALERGALRSKWKENCLHFCGDDNTAEFVPSHDHLRQSAQYLRSSSGHVRRIGLLNLS